MSISRRAFLKGTAAVAAAVPFIKAENLMNVWTPPEPEIFTGYGQPEIVTDAHSVNFSLSGLVPGCQVMVRNPHTGEVLINDRVYSRSMGWNISENMGGTPLQVFVRHPSYKAYVNQVGAPYPGGKTRVRGIQLQEDIVFA